MDRYIYIMKTNPPKNMGKVIMNQRKILSTIIVGLMLISTVVAITPIATATAYHAVWGTLRINNVIAGSGVQIRVTVPSKGFTTDITTTVVDLNGYNFYTAFDNPTYHGAKAYFTLLPRPTTEANSITLNKYKENVSQYYLFLNFTNSHPNAPSNPNPANGANDIETNADLSWTCSDPDGDLVSYDVYFGTTNPPTTKVSSNQAGTSYDPGALGSSTTYYWQIVATDNIAWDIGNTAGPVWSFTTKSGGTSPPTPPGGPSGPSGETIELKANPGGPYYGVINVELTFDGSKSTGTIISYVWSFGDGATGTGIKPKHTYSEVKKYTVTLTVTDDDGITDTNTTYATITATPNNPPTKPEVTGSHIGTKNVNYSYNAMSTDVENDDIKYIFAWGDGDTITTEFVPNGTTTTQTHKWSAAGVYTINVKANDNKTDSESTDYVVLIDALFVKDIGYLLDLDGDGTYDMFYSNETGQETAVQKQVNGTYLINSDSDSDWDWTYDPQPDTLTAYTTNEGTPKETKTDNTLWYALTIGTILAVILIALIYLATRKKQKPKK